MAATPLESKFITVEGVKLHYQELGSGYPVICMHGAGPGASAESNFKLNAGPFSEKFRVVLYDMPQYGKSDQDRADRTAADVQRAHSRRIHGGARHR